MRTSLLAMALIVVADQLTKHLAWSGSIAGRWIEPGLNHDLALGLGEAPTAIELVAALLGVIAVWWWVRGYATGRMPRLGAALVIGGSFGNLVDRVAFGAVRDFIVGPGVVYNVADVALACGVVLIVAWAARPLADGPGAAA